ncbi:lactonase family protein [Bradyrhizobium sp. Arg314]
MSLSAASTARHPISRARDQQSGKLDRVDFAPCGGATPRNLALSASGRHLISANPNADRISIFARDEASGRLTDNGHAIKIGMPMCVRIIEDPLRS